MDATSAAPVALNSGVFWPRRSLMRYPGTVIVEFLEPLPPGLERTVLREQLATSIETATARLVAEARSAQGSPSPETAERVSDLLSR